MTWGFFGSKLGRTIDQTYISGISITHGRNPRQHIWTYATGFSERYKGVDNCPCSAYPGYNPSSFVGINYCCEPASLDYPSGTTYYFNDTLWDGAGCIGGTCCDNTTQPWFHRELDQTTQDDIEA